MLKQIVGAILLIVGIAVAIHTVIEPLYHASSDGQPYSPFWNILNLLMVLSIILGLIFGYIRKKGVDSGDASLPLLLGATGMSLLRSNDE